MERATKTERSSGRQVRLAPLSRTLTPAATFTIFENLARRLAPASTI